MKTQFLLYACVLQLILLLQHVIHCKMHLKHNMSVVVCDFHITSNDAMQILHDRVLDNHKDYARIHDYHYYRQNMTHHINTNTDSSTSDRYIHHKHDHSSIKGKWEPHVHWSKIPLIIKLLSHPHSYDWVLWIDSDAIFYDMNKSVFDVITHNNVFSSLRGINVAKFIFSNDINSVINSGVMLFRKSHWTTSMLQEIWKIGELFELVHDSTIGEGGDNDAFAVFLGGCNSTNIRREELVACYQKTKIDHAATNAIANSGVEEDILDHIAILPTSEFNSQDKNSAKYIVHYPSPRANKEELLVDALKTLITHKGL